MKYAIRVTGLWVAVSLWAGSAFAVREGDLSQRFPIDDDDPKRSVPTAAQRNADPLEFGYWLQDMVQRAEVPFQAGQWSEAIKYYEAIGVALPDAAINYGRLCTAYENQGDLVKAEANCWAGLQHPGTKVVTYYQYLRLAIGMLAETSEDGKATRLERIVQTLDHLRAAAPSVHSGMAADRAALEQNGEKVEAEPNVVPFEVQVEVLNCQLGVATSDVARLEACTKALASAGTSRQTLVPFEWAKLKVKGASPDELKGFLAEAKRVGVAAAVLETLAASIETGSAVAPRVAKYQAPVDLVPAAPTAVEEAPAAPTEAELATSTVRGTSALENALAGLAALLGIGAAAWWLRERLLRRAGAAAPITTHPSA